MDGKLGLAIGYAHLDTPMATRGFGTYDPWNPSGGGGEIGCNGRSGTGCFANPGVAAGQYPTNGMKVRADMGSTERDGFMGTLQFEPSDTYSTTVDVFYSTMKQEDNARSLEVNLGATRPLAATAPSRPDRCSDIRTPRSRTTLSSPAR